ncbi:putative adenosine monophosphate-protein transferase Fic [Parasalinivibrio latis]|uniref:putative adenosine monophosphate-protein transferase Fic n=1 Tax=Parasalinivibrio latis TaxID=2952610 RepID=UPI0030E11BFB
MSEKYGTDQDPYVIYGTQTLKNRLGLTDPDELERAEHELTTLESQCIPFREPPYDLQYLNQIHFRLFREIYHWAGQLRTVDISKGDTHFCNVNRIEPEAVKLFNRLANEGYYVGLPREALVECVAEFYADLNMIHPYREGNGRAQRILFEHLIVNAGFSLSWQGITRDTWIAANIEGVYCNYQPLVNIFEHCIGQPLDNVSSQ